jgi:hypothetical protein
MKKQNTHHTVRAISTSTIKIVEKGQIYTPNTQIHDFNQSIQNLTVKYKKKKISKCYLLKKSKYINEQSVNITTDVVSSNLDQGEVYNVFNGYVIKFVSYLRRVGGLLRVLLFPQINKADRGLVLSGHHYHLSKCNKNVDIKFSTHNSFLE